MEAVYQGIAKEEGAYFLAASRYAHASSVDEEHLNEAGHRLLADAIYSKVIEILQPNLTICRLWEYLEEIQDEERQEKRRRKVV